MQVGTKKNGHVTEFKRKTEKKHILSSLKIGYSISAASHAVSHCVLFTVAAAIRVHFSVPKDYVT